MKLLITGAGLIGANTARVAVEHGHEVVLFDLAPNKVYVDTVVGADKVTLVRGDMRDLPALLRTLQTHQIDTLVHTAGLIGDRVRENSYTGTTNNILGTINVLEAAQLCQLQRVVYVSTFGVYDRSRIQSDRIHENHQTGRPKLYATTKVCSEQLLLAYADQYGLDTVIVRPSAVFGWGYYSGGSTVGQVMRDLIAQVAQSKGAGSKEIVLDASTYGAKEYLYGKDCSEGVYRACLAEAPRQRIYNLGSGQVDDVETLASIARSLAPEATVRITGTPKPLSREAAMPLDIDAARDELGFTPRHTLSEALADYLADYQQETQH